MIRQFVLLFVVVTAVSSVLVVESVFSSVPKPSVPEFTVNFVNASYTVTATNSYTGVDEIELIVNNSVEVTISNQFFGVSGSQIYYNVRVKPHFADNWTDIYPLSELVSSYNEEEGTFSYATYIDEDAVSQSESGYTVISFPVVPTVVYGASGYDVQKYYSGEMHEGVFFAFLSAIPEGSQLDFQVEALVGHDSQTWVPYHMLFAHLGGQYESAVAYDETSGWSSTETVVINGNQAPNSTLASTPASTLQESPQSEQEIITAVGIVIGVAGSAALLVYIIKRKQQH